MDRAFYSDSIADFLSREADEILGALARCSDFALEPTQRDAWLEEIRILHSALSACHGPSTLNIRSRAWADESTSFS